MEEAWRTTHEPRRCSRRLDQREVLVGVDLAVADHHVGLAAQDRRDQLGDVAPVVLVVGVGVDDHVGAELEAGVETRLEARGQPLVVGELDDVVDAVGSRGLDGGVGGAVVDDQPLDRVEPLDLAGQVRQRLGQLRFLVETGDLDDQLHGPRGAALPSQIAPRRGRADAVDAPWGRAIHHTVAGYSYMKMDTATASTPEPPRRLAVSPPSPGRRRGAWIRPADGRRRDLHRPALWLLLAVTLGLRLWGVKQGLPYSYNSDEATHFVPRAIAFFSHDYNPQYFLNPPAYSYLLHFVFELWFGGPDAVRRAYVANPTEVFVVARVVAAVLGTMAVWLTYLAGERLFNKTVGAAGGGDLRPGLPADLLQPPGAQRRARAGAGGARALRRGRGAAQRRPARLRDRGGRHRARRGHQVHGRDHGGVPDRGGGLRRRRRSAAEGRCAGSRFALGCAVLAFIAANPYSVLDFSAFHAGVTTQQALAGGSDPEKLGTTAASGTAFYVWTFTWGLGWAPSIAALAGSVLLRRAPPPGAGAGAAAGADRLHRVHGRPAALLRPLADADVPDRRAARRLRRGRGGALADPRPAGCRWCWPPARSRW